MDELEGVSDNVADKSYRIHVPPHSRFLKDSRLRVGIVGRTYKSGRKNEDWLPKLRELCGKNIEFITTYDNPIPAEQMPAFYEGVDYLLVIANKEGGPMPVVEALAMHKPVIAPDVGFCWEYPVIRYTGFDQLVTVLNKLTIPTDSWEQAAKEIESISLTLLSS